MADIKHLKADASQEDIFNVIDQHHTFRISGNPVGVTISIITNNEITIARPAIAGGARLDLAASSTLARLG